MKGTTEKNIYFITGASGVGKTTLLDHLMRKYRNKPWSFLHFDSIGIPSVLEMEKEFGSPSRWQEVKTHEWIDRVVHQYHDEKIFLEGQVNLQFIKNGFQKYNFKNYKIILIDCSEEKMEYRLTYNRAQPELFNEQMRKWLMYLRGQAEELEAIAIDTSNLSEEEAIAEFEISTGIYYS